MEWIIKRKTINFSFILAIVFYFFGIQNIFAADRTVNLTVGYKTVYFAGKTIKAIAVNNQIPAPTLYFKEGDHVTINVYNRLDEETAIHWHGLLVPWQMDGVLGIAQHGIPPNGVFHYQFTLYQSGTYWYHAHAGLQEQQGLYGAFLIDPPKHPSYKYTKDYVVVLSDWSNTHPDQILANLKKEGDYYSPRFPLQPSLIKFIDDYQKASIKERKNIIDDYKIMQQMRMSIYDISDVAYDAFLLNGKPNSNPWTAPVKVGDIVRLRFIGAGGSTIFHVKIPNSTMQMVHVQGNDVKPYSINDFKIAPGETFDVLVKIQKHDPYIIYAESIDTLGATYGALVSLPSQFVNYRQVTPFPEPLPVMRNMMSLMMENQDASVNMDMHANSHVMSHQIVHHESNMIDHKSHTTMTMKPSSLHSMHMKPSNSHPMVSIPKESIKNMSSGRANDAAMSSNMKMSDDMHMNHNMSMHSHAMTMPTESSVMGDTISQPNSFKKTIGTKYQNLIAAVKTNDPNKPVDGVIKMELFGYMDRFIWFINGEPEYKVHPIVLEPNKRYRFIFTNPSMMRHPMHMHGHWFILRNGHGSYDPLLHTIDVPPGATVTADLDTDASGQWLFHCHLLYHMMAGMSRVFQYSTIIEISKGEAKPQNFVKKTNYYNRPIVRIDEVRLIDSMLIHHPMAHHMGLYSAIFLDMGEDPFHNTQKLTFKGLYGRDYDKLELFTNDAEVDKGKVQNADIDIFYWHLLSQFWALKGGTNYFYRPTQSPYWQPGIGIEGLMPYFIDTNVRGYIHSGSAKIDAELSRDSQMTNNFFLRLGIRSIIASKTVTREEIGSGLNQIRYIVRPYYRLMPGLNVFAEYEYQKNYGAFKSLQLAQGESAIQNTTTLGLSILF
jgi:CopA family copper-resistance protein